MFAALGGGILGNMEALGIRLAATLLKCHAKLAFSRTQIEEALHRINEVEAVLGQLDFMSEKYREVLEDGVWPLVYCQALAASRTETEEALRSITEVEAALGQQAARAEKGGRA